MDEVPRVAIFGRGCGRMVDDGRFGRARTGCRGRDVRSVETRRSRPFIVGINRCGGTGYLVSYLT